mmetsp:Transcript_31807/g.92116  ORF Transcript_31807/g.92116 Transcript_31807/m.92116 type:complete len:193 (-) Transcript_31807:756-1334(-)
MPVSVSVCLRMPMHQELFRNCVNLADAVGMHLMLQSRRSVGFEPNTRLLGVGLGWAAADAIFQHMIAFLVGATGAEFEWTFIQRAISSNINMIAHLVFTVLVFIYGRKRLYEKYTYPVLAIGLLHLVGMPTIQSVFFTSPSAGGAEGGAVNPWSSGVAGGRVLMLQFVLVNIAAGYCWYVYGSRTAAADKDR